MSLALLLLTLQRDLPKEVREAFDKAESFELYSLDPSKRDGEGFHGWTILGKTTLKGDVAKAARDAVEAGAKESDGNVAKCFEPRHGIRLGSMDLVICFACLQTYVYKGGRKVDAFLTSASPAKALNRILSDAGIPLPEQPKK